jgi:hypothetical protein
MLSVAKRNVPQGILRGQNDMGHLFLWSSNTISSPLDTSYLERAVLEDRELTGEKPETLSR